MKDTTTTPISEAVFARAKQVQLLLLDVDGVLTDGTLYFSESGSESKGFNTQDGFGIRLLHEAGIETGVITARKSEIVNRRCNELQMRYTYLGSKNKITAYNDIIKKSGLKPIQIGYVGDDWLDLVLLKRVGFAGAPQNAVDEVKHVAHYTCSNSGGYGAVREVSTLILRAKGLLDQYLQLYMNR